MTNRFTTLAAAAALFIGLSSPAAADDLDPYASVGHWRMAANSTLCLADGGYANGTRLQFFLNTRGGASIGITHPDWNIPRDDYSVTVQVDRSQPTTFTATAQDGWVLWQYELNETALKLLSAGRTMFVTVGRQTYQYDLVRSEAMLKSLLVCAGTRMDAANPFSGTAPQASAPPANPFPETASNPYRRM